MSDIEIINLVPKFQEFFELSNKIEVDESERWRLWKKHYNFAAFPPGYEEQARKQLNQTWKKYQMNINRITNWKPDDVKVEKIYADVKNLFGCKQEIPFVIIFFVGAFDNNAFVAPYDTERSALCLPIETDVSDIVVAHELAHIIHAGMADLKISWERPVAEIILQEGLALQSSKYIVPGEIDEAYFLLDSESSWLQSCYQNRIQIFNGIIPHLSSSSSEIVDKFVFGTGTTGLQREAYYVGWEFVSSELIKDVTFKQLASIKQTDITEYVNANIVQE